MDFGNRPRVAACALLALVAAPGAWAEASSSADADSIPSRLERAFDNDYYKISIDVRARMELADFDGLDRSEAFTARTRAGIGTRSWLGFSAFAEIESSVAVDEDHYFDAVERPTGQSPIADPQETDLNQLWLRYENERAALRITGGRQRIILDDARFIGNVGWRQNEQTYDAVYGSTALGVEHLELSYGHVYDVQRIFGDDGPAATRDYESRSHLFRAAYDRFALARVALFAYLLDFDNSPGNSSNSYGLRVTGEQELGSGPWQFGYAASYAHQTDADDNPVGYDANYLAGDVHVGHAKLGTIGIGYELLGSDDGKARFVTPLATAHNFNGFADAFLNNGGNRGLRDAYAYLAPKLPWKLGAKVVYHQFRSDQGGDRLGQEIDVVVQRPINAHLSVLTKGAYFNGNGPGPADRWRFWVDVTFRY